MLCLCVPGQIVGNFLVVAVIARVLLGCDHRRTVKYLCLGIIAVAMVLAAADHQGGMKHVRIEEQRKAKQAIQSATSRDQP
jgi:hypothetical protein